MRGHALMMTPPMGPVRSWSTTRRCQENAGVTRSPLDAGRTSRRRRRSPIPSALAEIAKMLVAAKNPVIVADRAARTPAGVALLVKLAETLQVPVVDRLAAG